MHKPNGMKYGCFAIAVLSFCGSTAAHAALSISSDATRNVICDAGVCSATAKKAVLNVTDLTNMLVSSSLTIQTGSKAQDIVVDAPFSWTSGNGLTLDAYRSITVDKPVSDSGSGALTLTTNDKGSGGELLFLGNGSIGFQSASNTLTINGKNYVLEKSLPSLAAAIAKKRSGFYALANKYDASADGVYHASPINEKFSGYFQGLGNTIANLQMAPYGKKNTNVGLFAYLDTGGAIASVRLTNVNIQAKPNSSIGAVAGQNSGTNFNVAASGVISTNVGRKTYAVAGGIAGESSGVIDASASSVNISASGKDDFGVVGDVIAGGVAGGAVKITRSFATGSIMITGAHVASEIGGLVGSTSEDGDFENCFATGALTAMEDKPIIGGLVGNNYASVSRAYSVGVIKGTSPNIGGFIGYDASAQFGGKLARNYWDLDTSGINDPSQGAGNNPNDPGIKGLTDKQLKSGPPNGFDPTVWAQNPKINNGYPYLIMNSPPAK